MSFKMLHFAALHLDASFASVGMTPSVARLRREELRAALKRILNKAVVLQVNAITIAGDLYEQERVTADTANFLKAQFGALSNIPIIISPGNHDPYSLGSPYREVEWPPNVFIFSNPQLSSYKLSSGITIWGAAHNSPSFRSNLFEHFKAQGDGIHIALLHGSDVTRIPSKKDALCPFSPNQVAEARVDFALLGHYHGALIEPGDKPLYSYPGSPEPLGFDEEGVHYVLLVEVTEAKISPQLIHINAVNYRKIEIDVGNALSLEDINQLICSEGEESQLGNSLVRVILKGDLHPDVDLNKEAILYSCHESFRFLDIENRSLPAYELDVIKEESTVRGAFVRRMMKRHESCITEEEKGIVQRAIIYGLRALDAREINAI